MRLRETGVSVVRAVHELKRLRTDRSIVSDINGPDKLSFESFRFKKLGGVMLAGPHQIGFSGEDPNTGFSWQEGDIAMGMIVKLGFKSRYAPEKIKDSLCNLARYIAYNGLHSEENIKVVGGVTHRPLAIAATRYGFHTAQVPVNPSIEPSEIMSQEYVEANDFSPFELATAYRAHDVLDTYDKLGLGERRPPRARSALYAYMPTGEFLDRYGDTETEDWRRDPPEPHILGPFNEYGYPAPTPSE